MAPPGARRRPQFAAVNLISDPIHGYLELTRRMPRDEATAAGLAAEEAAEEDLLDSAWVQRLRRISQLQSARWVFPTAEHSRFTHGLGVMHEAGLWARSLYPTLSAVLPAMAPGEAVPSEGLVVETMRVAGLLHDVGHGPFAHYFDEQVLRSFEAPPDPRRPAGKRLAHEDLSQLIIERELGPTISALRRAPGTSPPRDAFADGESVDPAWVSFLVSKPALADDGMPRWVRILQPLLSGVFTVDNLDYVRRDAYMTGVSTGPVDVERLRRYSFVSERGLTVLEPGLPALEMFLTTRLFLHQQVYYHRTVRALDLDLAPIFWPSVRAIFGDGSPAERLAEYADLDEYALLHQAARWARGELRSTDPRPGDGTVTESVAEGWRGVLLRRPRWRAEREVRRTSDDGTWPPDALAELGPGDGDGIALDLVALDGRPARPDDLLAIEARDGSPGPTVAGALGRIPAWILVGRRYRRIG